MEVFDESGTLLETRVTIDNSPSFWDSRLYLLTYEERKLLEMSLIGTIRQTIDKILGSRDTNNLANWILDCDC